MYNPGGEYLTYIKNSLVRKPRAKIVVDGKTYTGVEHLASFPKITHETEKMIGGFPAKTCDFEIYNLDGTIDLNGKEVQIYRGLYVNDTKTVWVPMGLFYADGEDVTNNSTKRTIQFKGTDRTRLFDSPFTKIYGNGVIPSETLISSVAEKICKTHNLAIDSSTKGNIVSHRLSESVGVPEGTTDRQVIAWIAELSGCIPIISRDGSSLVFTRPNYKSNVYDSGQTYPSGSYADKSKYKTLSAEPLFGPINAVSFGHADYDDAYVYQNDADVEANGLHEWQINDNPLAENSKAELAPKVFNIIKGMKLYPFTLTDFIDDFLFDINDGILIKKKDDTLITTYVLGMSTTSRIRSTFKTNTQDYSTADRSLAGSVKEDLKRVKLSVDHTKAEITALAKESEEKFTQLKQTTDGLYADINDAENGLKAAMTATAEKAESAFEKATKVENAGYITTEDAKTLISQSADNITLAVEQNIKIGARNILLDSACFASFTPQGYSAKIIVKNAIDDPAVPSWKASAILFASTQQNYTTDTSGFSFVGSDILGQSDDIDKIKVNTNYVLTFWIKSADEKTFVLNKSKLIDVGSSATVTFDESRCTWSTVTSEWKKFSVVFSVNGGFNTFGLRFTFDGLPPTEGTEATLVLNSNKIQLSSLKLEEGNIATDWTPSAEDVEQSVKAQISMCVQKDKNGKLTSAIAIEGNKISIESDNFVLAEDGTITKCNGAQITNGVIKCGDDNFNMTIGGGIIVHTFNDTTVGQITTMAVPDDNNVPKYYETMLGNAGVCLSAPNCFAYLDEQGLLIQQSADKTFLNVMISKTEDWSYGSITLALRSAIVADSGLILSANSGQNDLMLQGYNVWLCGHIRIANYYKYDSENIKEPLYVNTTTGEITT